MNQTEQPKAKISVTFNNRDGIKTVSPQYSPGDTVSFTQHQTDEYGEIHDFMVYIGEVQFINIFDFLAEEFTYCIKVEDDNLAEYPEVFESEIKGRVVGEIL